MKSQALEPPSANMNQMGTFTVIENYDNKSMTWSLLANIKKYLSITFNLSLTLPEFRKNTNQPKNN